MPFRLKRKAERFVPRTKYQPIRYIVGVEPVGKGAVHSCGPS